MTATGTAYPFAQLPGLSAAEARLIEALHEGAAGWQHLAEALGRRLVQFQADATVATIGAVTAERARSGLTAGWLAELGDPAGDALGVAHLDTALVQSLAADLLGGVSASPEVRPLLDAEIACVTTLVGIGLAESDLPVVLSAAGPDVFDRLSDELLGRVMLRLTHREISGWLTVWVASARFAERLRSHRRDTRPRLIEAARLGSLGQLRRPIQIHLASFQGAQNVLLSLKLGDVLLPRTWIQQAVPNRGRLRWGGRTVAEVELEWSEGVQFRLAAEPPSAGAHVTDESREDRSDRTTLMQLRPVIDRLEQLEIVVGGATMSLADILELKPGRVFSLDVPADAPVELVLEGRTIGRAELVDVGGRLGVRVLSISS